MSFPFQQAAFAAGEIGPPLFGRQDLARTHVGASTMRNMFVRYTGGSASRSGTRFVGFSKQTGRAFPPRLITFQFNINQGLALEFGNQYMRVVQNGAFVTDVSLNISNITRANPGVVTVAAASGGLTATANTGAVASSYAPGEQVTLAGGTYSIPAVISVTNTLLLDVEVDSPGIGNYAPADTISLTGGTQTTPAELTVATTQVVSATIAAAGAGGTPGTATVTGTTGTGTLFQAEVTINGGGAIASVDAITLSGSYTANPTVPTAEPVTGGGLAGAQLNVVLGVETVTVSDAGVFTANPTAGVFVQDTSSGTGTGATFRFALMGPNAVTFSTAGVYTAFPANPVAQASSTGGGTGVTFTVTSGAVTPFSNGDWVSISGVGGMTEVNGEIFVVAGATPTTFQLTDVYGNLVNTTAYTAYSAGGVASRIFTLSTPWAEADIEFLKFTQSADVMSLCCRNQDTGTEYPPYDLARIANNNWSLAQMTPASGISPPPAVSGSATASGTTFYQYVVTSIDPDDGSESVASVIANIPNAVNISSTAGSITVNWTPVAGVRQYNIYKAQPGYGTAIPVGALFGFAGTTYGTSFIDSNIVPDFSQVPPLYTNPFARGAVTGVTITNGGSGYFTSATITVNSGTGSGAVIAAVAQGGVIVGAVIYSAGSGYIPSDTITITGDGSGATATLTVGALTGTYPSAVSYVQQRRLYANSQNQPNTYWMSQPGAFTNFDRRIPTIDSDAITGNPWAVQVNGIQFVVNMPGGGIVLTGDDAWQLTGNGGSSLNPQPITPSTQQAQPQAYNGCHTHIPPIKIDYDILYVQAKGSIVRNLSYQYYQNIYTGIDLTLNSPQLFTGFTLREWAWCEEPFKIAWAVRNEDGVLLSLTFVKPQEVAGWARHDTQGFFVSCCSVTEPPVDALYVATQRFPGANTAYMIERMDDRLWRSVEDVWAVDCGISLAQPTPAATLRASSATGGGTITGATVTAGGSGYTSGTTVTIVDDNGQGPGSGATATATIAGGVITGITITAAGSGYTYPSVVISDPAGSAGGSGATATATLANLATFTASASVFAAPNVGRVIRMGGGVAVITGFISGTQVTANIISPIVDLIPNTATPAPAAAGEWTMTTPVSSVSGLRYLAGMTVTGLYDGKVIPPTLVPATGTINLPSAASQVTVGLGYGAQLQSLYLDPQGVTVQGRRKKIADVVVRVQSSGAFEVGSNQPDGSVQSPVQLAPTWRNMTEAETGARAPYNSTTTPLWTGDIRIPVFGGFGMYGQAAVQQLDPLPLEVLSFISEFVPGDMPEDEPKRRSRGRMADAEG